VPTIAAAGALIVSMLTACSDDSDLSPTPGPAESASSDATPPTEEPRPDHVDIAPDPEADAWTLDQIEWHDGDDGEAALVFSPPFGVTGPTARLVADGTGAEILEGDTVTFEYSMYAGDTGALAFSTRESGRPQTIAINPQGMSQSFADALVGSHVGAKIIFATIDSSGNSLSDKLVTMFMAVEVTGAKAPLDRATGEAIEPKPGLPVVTLADDGAPRVDVPSHLAPPQELVSEYLIRGAGPELERDQTAIVKFTALFWDGTEFDSTWHDGASMAWRLIVGESMPGLIRGLVGKTVGSQVLLVIPPDLGFGEFDLGEIPGGSTLVYVIDIVDVQ